MYKNFKNQPVKSVTIKAFILLQEADFLRQAILNRHKRIF
jgi:hypothetical protein